MSFLFSNQFDSIIEEATSENTVIGTENIALYLDIADKIKAKNMTTKQFISGIRKRLNHKNPNVQILALSLVVINH